MQTLPFSILSCMYPKREMRKVKTMEGVGHMDFGYKQFSDQKGFGFLEAIILVAFVLGFSAAYFSQSTKQANYAYSSATKEMLGGISSDNLVKLSYQFKFAGSSCNQDKSQCPNVFVEPFQCGDSQIAKFRESTWSFIDRQDNTEIPYKTLNLYDNQAFANTILKHYGKIASLAEYPNVTTNNSRFELRFTSGRQIQTGKLNRYLSGANLANPLISRIGDKPTVFLGYYFKGIECNSKGHPKAVMVESIGQTYTRNKNRTRNYYKIPLETPKPSCDISLSKTVLATGESSVTMHPIAGGVWTSTSLPESVVQNEKALSIADRTYLGPIEINNIQRVRCTNDASISPSFTVTGIDGETKTCSMPVFFNVPQSTLDAECPPPPTPVATLNPAGNTGGNTANLNPVGNGNGAAATTTAATPTPPKRVNEVKMEKYAPTKPPRLTRNSGNPPPRAFSKRGKALFPTWQRGGWKYVFGD